MEHDEGDGHEPRGRGAFIAKTALRASSRPLIALGLPYTRRQPRQQSSCRGAFPTS